MADEPVKSPATSAVDSRKADKKTTLRVLSPWVSSYTFPTDEDGNTVVVTHEPTEVSASQAPDFVSLAASNGVTLVLEVSE